MGHRVTVADKTFFAPCPRGLEGVLSEELESLGAPGISPTQGGVGFTGSLDLCYRVNLHSRIASRVLWLVAQGRYRHEQDLYDVAYGQPWPAWFSPRCTIKVKVSAQRCPLKSLDFVTLRIKDAICDRFAAVTRTRPSVDTRRPDIRIDVFLDDKEAALYLDTTGDALFKRGLRRASTEAPLRENLAAGILRLAGWTEDQVLLDPMCGGGTILMEAALIADHVAPGLGRGFAFERLANFDRRMWSGLREEARAQHRPRGTALLYGCDLDAEAIERAKANLGAAGLSHAVTLAHANALDIEPPAESGILVTNPPYGVRLGEAQELAHFYPRLGDVLKQRFPGWRAYVLTADPRLPKLIGLAPSRRIPLFNGALECRLFEFILVRGSARRLLRGGRAVTQA